MLTEAACSLVCSLSTVTRSLQMHALITPCVQVKGMALTVGQVLNPPTMAVLYSYYYKPPVHLNWGDQGHTGGQAWVGTKVA